MTTGTFSMRGTYDAVDNAVGTTINIFDYVSPDRTRAWKVARAYLWPVETRASTGSDGDGKMTAQATLSTDYRNPPTWADQLDPGDNRAFAWAIWSGYTRENGGSDFILAHGTDGIVEFIIDPDTYITKELWIAVSSTKEGTTNPTRAWGYLIVFEEHKITPSQSVFQQIKGMGQDVEG